MTILMRIVVHDAGHAKKFRARWPALAGLQLGVF
jgi:hypothetical protein